MKHEIRSSAERWWKVGKLGICRGWTRFGIATVKCGTLMDCLALPCRFKTDDHEIIMGQSSLIYTSPAAQIHTERMHVIMGCSEIALQPDGKGQNLSGIGSKVKEGEG